MFFIQIHKHQVKLLNFLLKLLERLLPLCLSAGKPVKGEWEPGDEEEQCRGKENPTGFSTRNVRVKTFYGGWEGQDLRLEPPGLWGL
jgi:hypothetical protein